MAKPVLAITMGDAAGIGPEVIVAAWQSAAVHEAVRPLVIGHPEILRRAVSLVHPTIEVREISAEEAAAPTAEPHSIPCLRAGGDEVLDVPPGRVDRRAGEAAYQAVRLAARLALEHKVDGIVTAPLSKAALHAAGHCYPGHTELLAEMCGAKDFAMMLFLSKKCDDARAAHNEIGRSSPRVLNSKPRTGLGVVHVTLHQSLRSVFDDLTPSAILSKCQLADAAMRRLGIPRPRLAVCALNPHAGEEGLFGGEERTIIAPAVETARAAGLVVTGPIPADTLMVRARDGEFDAVVAMYHDQGHIAVKLMGMHEAVNITLGLPIVRTSVAHGTAFDRAWQGTARSEGMVAAILAAKQMCGATEGAMS
jgi:4-hydroxythreonine-4-phosphate dehydrogenase